MSKNISAGLKSDLQHDVTTLATCWDITRTDGVTLAFTDHDQDLVVSGVTYKASTGYARTAMKADPTMAVDNIDVQGILDSTEISDTDLKARKFDYATFHIFAINWMNLTNGPLKMRTGWLGEAERLPTGIYKIELRGLTQALVTETANNFQPLCRADLGDTKCKVPIKPGNWAPNQPVAVGTTGPYGGVYVLDPSPIDDTHALALYQCTTAGTTGSVAPSFNPTVGATTTESTGVVWTSVAPWRGAGTVSAVTSNSVFTTSSLGFNPGANGSGDASVRFANIGEAPNNLTVTITVGASTLNVVWPTTYNSGDSVYFLTNSVNAAHATGFPCAAASYFSSDDVHATILHKINPADVGSVTKSNDPQNWISIVGGAWNLQSSAFLTGGLITWVTGLNRGVSMECKSFDPNTNTMRLLLSMPFAVASGDKFYFQPGCDKSRLMCFSRYNNIWNFRAEPDVPGMDEYMNYPDALS